MRTPGIAAPPSAACHPDPSEQEQVARAFVAAAIRLAPVLPLPADPSSDAPSDQPSDLASNLPTDLPTDLPTERDRFPTYRGRHRRSIAAVHSTACQTPCHTPHQAARP